MSLKGCVLAEPFMLRFVEDDGFEDGEKCKFEKILIYMLVQYCNDSSRSHCIWSTRVHGAVSSGFGGLSDN